MAFADKKGIVVASPFKLQAESLLDVRQQVDTIKETNELVTIKAATAGLRVYVKETKKSYVYNGTGLYQYRGEGRCGAVAAAVPVAGERLLPPADDFHGRQSESPHRSRRDFRAGAFCGARSRLRQRGGSD